MRPIIRYRPRDVDPPKNLKAEVVEARERAKRQSKLNASLIKMLHDANVISFHEENDADWRLP